MDNLALKQVRDVMQSNGAFDALQSCLAEFGERRPDFNAILDCMGKNGYAIEDIAENVIEQNPPSLDTLDDLEQADYNLTNMIKNSLDKHKTVAQAIVDGLIQYYIYYVKQFIRDTVSKGV